MSSATPSPGHPATLLRLLWAYFPSLILAAFSITLWTIRLIVIPFVTYSTCGPVSGPVCLITNHPELATLIAALTIAATVLLIVAGVVAVAIYKHRLKMKLTSHPLDLQAPQRS